MATADSLDEPVSMLVARVREALGVKLTAYIGGASSTGTVTDWVTNGVEVTPEIVARLSVADTVAGLLLKRDAPAVVQAWFAGMNPDLGDIAPARLLREGDLATVGPEVLAAARSSLSA